MNSRTLQVTAVDDIPDGIPLQYDVSAKTDQITPSVTPELELSVTNRSDSTFELATPYYEGSSDFAGPPGILLYSRDSLSPGGQWWNYRPSCFSGDGKTKDRIGFTSELPPTQIISPAQNITNELVVVDDPGLKG